MDKDAEIRMLKQRVSTLEEAIGDLYSALNELAAKAGIAQRQRPKSPYESDRS